MNNLRPYLMDLLAAVILALLPGIRGYDSWQVHEYALLALIFAYIVYLHHRKPV